jgi:hypothetical protein
MIRRKRTAKTPKDAKSAKIEKIKFPFLASFGVFWRLGGSKSGGAEQDDG